LIQIGTFNGRDSLADSAIGESILIITMIQSQRKVENDRFNDFVICVLKI
jgi:hypothetical protein